MTSTRGVRTGESDKSAVTRLWDTFRALPRMPGARCSGRAHGGCVDSLRPFLSMLASTIWTKLAECVFRSVWSHAPPSVTSGTCIDFTWCRCAWAVRPLLSCCSICCGVRPRELWHAPASLNAADNSPWQNAPRVDFTAFRVLGAAVLLAAETRVAHWRAPSWRQRTSGPRSASFGWSGRCWRSASARTRSVRAKMQHIGGCERARRGWRARPRDGVSCFAQQMHSEPLNGTICGDISVTILRSTLMEPRAMDACAAVLLAHCR